MLAHLYSPLNNETGISPAAGIPSRLLLQPGHACAERGPDLLDGVCHVFVAQPLVFLAARLVQFGMKRKAAQTQDPQMEQAYQEIIALWQNEQ